MMCCRVFYAQVKHDQPGLLSHFSLTEGKNGVLVIVHQCHTE
jgi:hypothetical protein